MKLLEENNRQGQAQDLSLLMFYMDGMTRQFEAVSQELQEVRQQLAQAQESPAKKVIGRMVEALGHKVEKAREALDNLREKIMDCAKNAVENFKEAGVSALDKAVSAIGAKNALESLQEKISGMIADTKQNIEKVENIGHELRSVGGHLKNAGRAITGKETQTVDGGQEGRFQSVVLAPMRTTKSLLSSMNNATLAAIGGMESLDGKPIPKVAQLSQEYTALLAEKQEQYAEYKALRQDMIAYRTAKQNVDKILGIMPEEQEQNRDQRPER